MAVRATTGEIGRLPDRFEQSGQLKTHCQMEMDKRPQSGYSPTHEDEAESYTGVAF